MRNSVTKPIVWQRSGLAICSNTAILIESHRFWQEKMCSLATSFPPRRSHQEAPIETMKVKALVTDLTDLTVLYRAYISYIYIHLYNYYIIYFFFLLAVSCHLA